MACWNFLEGSRKSVPTPSLFLELPKVYPPLAQGYTGAGSGATVASQAIENIFFFSVVASLSANVLQQDLRLP